MEKASGIFETRDRLFAEGHLITMIGPMKHLTRLDVLERCAAKIERYFYESSHELVVKSAEAETAIAGQSRWRSHCITGIALFTNVSQPKSLR